MKKLEISYLELSPQKSCSIPLTKAIVKFNPHVKVLCPTLAKKWMCKRTGFVRRGEKKEVQRPQLLIKNHNKPNLQLWHCQGCPNTILRVEIPCRKTHLFPEEPQKEKTFHYLLKENREDLVESPLVK